MIGLQTDIGQVKVCTLQRLRGGPCMYVLFEAKTNRQWHGRRTRITAPSWPSVSLPAVQLCTTSLPPPSIPTPRRRPTHLLYSRSNTCGLSHRSHFVRPTHPTWPQASNDIVRTIRCSSMICRKLWLWLRLMPTPLTIGRDRMRGWKRQTASHCRSGSRGICRRIARQNWSMR